MWRIAELEKHPIGHSFVSFEPLLGSIYFDSPRQFEMLDSLDLAIIGCESGPGRRPTKLSWVQSLCEQCWQAGVPVHVKQLEIDGKVCHKPELIAKALGTTPEEIRQEDQ
jgi:protein gp37